MGKEKQTLSHTVVRCEERLAVLPLGAHKSHTQLHGWEVVSHLDREAMKRRAIIHCILIGGVPRRYLERDVNDLKIQSVPGPVVIREALCSN